MSESPASSISTEENAGSFDYTSPFAKNANELAPLRMTGRLDSLADFFAPGFEILFHLRHELVGDRAVDEAMVVAESEVDDGADGDGVGAIFVGDDHGLLGDAANAHDGRVGLVDDGESEDGAELAGVRDGEGGPFDVVGFEFFGASAFAEIGDSALQAEEVEISGILQNGDDESPIQGNGDSYVDVAVITDVVVVEAGVDDGPLLQRDDGGAHEEGHEGEAGAVALLEAGFVFGTEIHDSSEVHFVHAVNVGAGAAGLDHALRDDLAHV